MSVLTLSEIEAQTRRLAGKIGAPDRLLPTFGRAEDSGPPGVHVDGDLLHYVIMERGRELERRTFVELSDLLCAIFSSLVFEMAGEFEMRHRLPGQDARRIRFSKEIELLGILSTEWAMRRMQEHEDILARAPFDDAAVERALLAKRLSAAGEPPDSAWRKACDLYPLPTTR